MNGSVLEATDAMLAPLSIVYAERADAAIGVSTDAESVKALAGLTGRRCCRS